MTKACSVTVYIISYIQSQLYWFAAKTWTFCDYTLRKKLSRVRTVKLWSFTCASQPGQPVFVYLWALVLDAEAGCEGCEEQIEGGDCRWEETVVVAGGAALMHQNCLPEDKMSNRCLSGRKKGQQPSLMLPFSFPSHQSLQVCNGGRAPAC